MDPAHRAHGAPLTGLHVFEQFEVAELRASDARGETYVGRDLQGGPPVAVRFLAHPAFSQSARTTWSLIAERFDRLCALDHPYVERVLTGGVVRARREDLLCVVTEPCEGRSLAALLRADGPLAPIESLGLLRRVGEGLRAVHDAGIVHGDLRAANVLLPASSDVAGARLPMLTEVGVQHLLADALGRHLTTQDLGWSPESAAPEQIRGEHADVGTDVYAFGLLLYRALTGATPWAGDNPSDLLIAQLSRPPRPLRDVMRERTPDRLDALLDRCLAKARTDRYASMAPLLTDLEVCLRELIAQSGRGPRVDPLRGATPLRSSTARPIRRAPDPPAPPRRERVDTLKGPRPFITGEHPAASASMRLSVPAIRAATSASDTTAPLPALADTSLRTRAPADVDAVLRALRPMAFAAIVLTLLCGLAGGYLAAAWRPSPTAQSRAALVPTAPHRVRVRVRTQAPDARVTVRGATYDAPMNEELTVGVAPEMIEVSAPGFETRRLWLPFDEHIDARVDLVAEAPAVAPAQNLTEPAPDTAARARHRTRRTRRPRRPRTTAVTSPGA